MPASGSVLNPFVIVDDAAGLVIFVSEVFGVRAATAVTEPTPFHGGTTLGRMLDPWRNLWWRYAPAPGRADPTPHWDGGTDTVFSTLDAALRSLAG